MRLVLSASNSPLEAGLRPPLHKTSGPNFIMPWSNQSGGGGWKGGGGPWGPRPSPGQQPDLEEILRRSQDRLRQAMPGARPRGEACARGAGAAPPPPGGAAPGAAVGGGGGGGVGPGGAPRGGPPG